MSKIKVNEIEAATGSTVTIPTGQTFSVADGIPATNLSGTIADARLPTVPVAKGGTGLTSLGSANQQIRVNSGGNALEFATVTAGGILQVKKTLITNKSSVSCNNSAFADVSGYSVAITPTAANSQILILGMINVGGVTNGANRLRLRLLRDSTHITANDTVGSRLNGFFGIYEPDGYEPEQASLTYWDAPNTTSATTYKLQCIHNNSNTENIYFNQPHNDANNVDTMSGVSSLVVMEIANGVL